MGKEFFPNLKTRLVFLQSEFKGHAGRRVPLHPEGFRFDETPASHIIPEPEILGSTNPTQVQLGAIFSAKNGTFWACGGGGVAPTTHAPKDHRKRQEEGQMDLIQREGHPKGTKPTVATPKPKHTSIQSQNQNYDSSKNPSFLLSVRRPHHGCPQRERDSIVQTKPEIRA